MKKERKLTISRIVMNLDKIQINKAPVSIQGNKALKTFIDKQGFYIKPGTLSHHKKQLYRWTTSHYNNIYSRGGFTAGKTIYCKQFIEDCLKISICLHIGLKEFVESTRGRKLYFTCK